VRRACLWRAQRAWSSARGQRDVAVCLTSSAASAFVYAGQVAQALVSPFGPCDRNKIIAVSILDLQRTKIPANCARHRLVVLARNVGGKVKAFFDQIEKRFRG